jgi:hypothetical protein
MHFGERDPGRNRRQVRAWLKLLQGQRVPNDAAVQWEIGYYESCQHESRVLMEDMWK